MQYNSEYWNDVDKVLGQIPSLEKIFHKTILITGATGMVCSSIVDLIYRLNKKYDAQIRMILAGRNRKRISDRFDSILDNTGYLFLEFDAARENEINIAADFIIHGASNANPAVYAKEPAETLLGNIIGTRSVLELARKNKGSRILFVSSSEIYGNRYEESDAPYYENEYGYIDVLNPRACYPNGKRAAETLCACYREEYGVDAVITRLGHIYGPSITGSDTRASASFTRDAAAGREIVMKSAGAQFRSYCYTLDCASAIMTVLINGKSGEAYNISNKNSVVSIRDMAEALARAGHVPVRFENPSDEERRSYNLMQNSSLGSEKIEALGWKAIFDLDEGASRTIRFY